MEEYLMIMDHFLGKKKCHFINQRIAMIRSNHNWIVLQMNSRFVLVLF
jgi:hypothetical protein